MVSEILDILSKDGRFEENCEKFGDKSDRASISISGQIQREHSESRGSTKRSEKTERKDGDFSW